MKTSILTLTSITLIQAVNGQTPVTDAAQLQQNEMHHQRNMIQSERVIQNQNEQTTILNKQLVELQTLNRVTGDPAKVSGFMGINSAMPSGVVIAGKPGGSVTVNVSGTATFTYDGGGMFSAVGGSFRMLTGRDVQRTEESYRSFAAVDGSAALYNDARQAATTRISALRQAMAAAHQEKDLAVDDATVQKRNGTLLFLGAELQASIHEATLAAQQVQLQDIANRNDQMRQAEARREEQVSEIGESFVAWARPQPTRANSRLTLKRR